MRTRERGWADCRRNLTRGLPESNTTDTSFVRADDLVARTGEAMRDSQSNTVEPLLTLVTLIWAGMVIGVSLLATPAKFAAPSLTLPVALDIGRHTFGVFTPIEIGAAAIATALAALSRRRVVLALIAVVDGVVGVQAAWLLPVLDARVEVILTGGTVADSPLHEVYIALEGAKLLVLLTVGAGLLFHRDAPGLRHGRGSHRRPAPRAETGAPAEDLASGDRP